MKIEIYLDIPKDVQDTRLTLTLNNVEVTTPPANEKNEHGHYAWIFDADVQEKNILKLEVQGLGDILDKTKYLNVAEIIIDDIKFDIVHTMNTWAYPNGLEPQRGATQLDNDGYIEMPFNLPVWEYWCQVNNNFRYEEYPLWQ